MEGLAADRLLTYACPKGHLLQTTRIPDLKMKFTTLFILLIVGLWALPVEAQEEPDTPSLEDGIFFRVVCNEEPDMPNVEDEVVIKGASQLEPGTIRIEREGTLKGASQIERDTIYVEEGVYSIRASLQEPSTIQFDVEPGMTNVEIEGALMGASQIERDAIHVEEGVFSIGVSTVNPKSGTATVEKKVFYNVVCKE